MLFYCDHFVLPLPEGHRFPMAKYRLLRERLAASGEFEDEDFQLPHAATDEELGRAHCAAYRDRVQAGQLDAKELREIGFPWSAAMVERSRRSSGATLDAARVALARGWGANLAGGTHHAYWDKGSGFCVFNDAAVTARAMQTQHGIDRVLVIDCDVHQGNGTAAITREDASIFTFSIHGAKNFPFRKEASDLDIELADGTSDAEYLDELEDGLAEVFDRFAPRFAIYVSGADPYEDDRLGRLKLSKRGLMARDEHVFGALAARAIPVAVTMAGGYARNIHDTVEIHANTVLTAKRVLG